MARGMWVTAETRTEAEEQIDVTKHEVRIVACRKIDLSGLPPLKSGPLPTHWVVVIEDLYAELEARRPQQDDPEGECEREVRLMYLKMATDPELLVAGTWEQLDCPACGESVSFEGPAPRERKKPDPGHRDCPECGIHLSRTGSNGEWEVFVAPRKPDKTCIFCGARADSMEHVIPAWIAKRLDIRGQVEPRRTMQIGRAPRRQPISFGSYRARIFCGDCNKHFHHLEDEVIPWLVPMARGVPVSLGAESRAVIARWAVKTAMALLSAEPGDQDIVPRAHRKALREEGRVVADTWVGLFRWHGPPTLITGQSSAPFSHPDGRAVDEYSALLAFEGLGFYVTAFHEDLPVRLSLVGDRPPMISFLPVRSDMIHWPPPATDDRMLPSLLNWTPLED
ncbi:MAG TPA: hypothetical protein VFY75_07980 [Solirubrobacterales bacterium]|nr:hypothetical protein [Solirubrobacterales bacterium]